MSPDGGWGGDDDLVGGGVVRSHTPLTHPSNGSSIASHQVSQDRRGVGRREYIAD